MQLHWIDTHSYSYSNSYLVLEKGSRLERLQISQFKQIQAMSGAKAPLTSSPTKCVQLNAKWGDGNLRELIRAEITI